MLYSIITVTKNHIDGLKNTLEGILGQTFTDFEWIVIDGESCDGTADFLGSLSLPFMRFISEPDTGLYDAMNKGIACAKGTYVLFLNAGDTFASPDILQDIAQIIHNKHISPDLIYGDALEEGQTKGARHADTIAWGMFTHHQSMFYKRATIGLLRYDLAFRIAADYDFTLRFLNGGKETLYIPKPVCIFEIGGLSQRQARLGRHEQFLSRRKNGPCGLIKNCGIYVLQSFSYSLRRYMPKIYWFLKARKTGFRDPAP